MFRKEPTANTQNVIRAPYACVRRPPTRLPVPAPRPQYIPCRNPCNVPRYSDGTFRHKYFTYTDQIPAKVNPEIDNNGKFDSRQRRVSVLWG